MEARLLIAFVLMGLVLFLTPYIYKPAAAPAPGANKPATSKTTDPVEATAPPPAAPAPVIPVAAAAAAEMPGQIHGDQEETVVVDTGLCHIVFSSKGAVVKSWVLRDFKDHNGKPLDLVNAAALAKVPAPFSIEFKGQKPTFDPNTALFKLDRDGYNLAFEFSDGRVDVKKTFQFAKDSYLARVTSQVSQTGVMLPHSLEWRGGFGDETVSESSPVSVLVVTNIGAQELAPFGKGRAVVGHHGLEQLHAQDQPAKKAREVEQLEQPARPGDQAHQPDGEGHANDGGQQHGFTI